MLHLSVCKYLTDSMLKRAGEKPVEFVRNLVAHGDAQERK